MARDAVDDDLRDLDEATVEAIRDAVDHQERPSWRTTITWR